MFCQKCGKQNREGASYCTECGRELMRSAAAHKEKKHRGIYLAAALSLPVIAAAVISCFVLFSGTPVEGQWYSAEAYSVLEFKGGQAQMISLNGTERRGYEYNRQNGEGTLKAGSGICAFGVKEDVLTLKTNKGDINYLRAKEEVNIQRLVKGGLLGLWSNEKRAQVLQLKEDGGFTLYSIEGEQESAYDFDIESGEGSLSLGGGRSVFKADKAEIDIIGSGVFTKQESGFDIKAFIAEYGKPLDGVWYDSSGVMGRFWFQDEGRLSVASYGKEYRGTYTFSNAEGKGTLSFGGITMDIGYYEGKLKIRGQAFSKVYVTQKGAKDVFEQVAGKWYDKQGNGTIEISAGGTAVFKRDGKTQSAVCTFNPLSGMGRLELSGGNGIKALNLLLSNGMLAAGEWLYTREVVEQKNSGILGTWYDTDKRVGALTLEDGGAAELDYSGSKYIGTYSFDEALGKGTITTVFSGKTWTFDMELRGDQLIIKTGIMFYNEVVFAREAPGQP